MSAKPVLISDLIQQYSIEHFQTAFAVMSMLSEDSINALSELTETPLHELPHHKQLVAKTLGNFCDELLFTRIDSHTALRIVEVLLALAEDSQSKHLQTELAALSAVVLHPAFENLTPQKQHQLLDHRIRRRTLVRVK